MLLDNLTDQAHKSTIKGFSERFSGIYLLGEIPESHAGGFATRVGAPSNQDLIKALRSNGNDCGPFLVRVEKSDRNTWKSRISVGRAKNNDIVLRHDSVSKLHAHFYVRLTKKNGQVHEKLVLCDVGSANGTLINGRTLDEDAEVVVAFGDRFLFGEVQCDLLDPVALYTKLRRLSARSGF